MTSALTVNENGRNTDIITFDEDKVGLIKRTIAKGATDDELALFLHQAQKTGLDPLARQIYFQKYNTKNGPQIAIITGIDGYRLVADRTGKYAGQDEPRFEGRIAATFYKDSFDAPAKATVTVYKIVGNRRVGFSASVYWNEYYPGEPKGHMWRKMPHVMLAKCAEAAALRKAFPADLSGVYTHEEMGQADWFNQDQDADTIDADFDQTTPHDDDDFNQDTERPTVNVSNAPEAEDKDDFGIASNVADIRASLEEYPRMTGIQVADAAIQTGKYNGRDHVESTLKKHHEGFAKSGGKLSAGVDRAVALEWFDFLMEHEAEKVAA